MISRVEALVLRTVKFQDSGLVVALYSLELGRLDVLVKGARSARRRAFRLQPLALIDAVVYQRQGRELQHLSEWHSAHAWANLDQHPVKVIYGMLLAEVVLQSVREHEANPPLYALLRATLQALDEHASGWYELCLHALVQLTRHLGFFPNANGAQLHAAAFDVETGLFEPASVATADPVVDALLLLVSAPEAQPPLLHLAGPERKALLHLVLRMYLRHVEGFRPPRSLEVFEALFR